MHPFLLFFVSILLAAMAAPSACAAAGAPPRPAPADMRATPPTEDPVRMARTAMIAALCDDKTMLRAAAVWAETAERDTPNAERRIGDEAALLEAWAIAPGAERDGFLERILSANPSEEVRQRASHALRTEPLRRVRDIRRQDRLNRFALIFNSFSRIGTHAVIGDIQGAAQAFVDTLLVWKPLTQLTPRNRQAADIYERTREEIRAAGYRDDDVARYTEKIQRKRRRLMAEELVTRGRWHLANARPEMARRAFRLAAQTDPDNGDAERLQLEAATCVSALKRIRLAAQAVEHPLPRSDTEEGQAVANLARAMCAESAAGVRARALGFLTRFPLSSFAADAAYCLAAIDCPSSQSLPNSVPLSEYLERDRSHAGKRYDAWKRSVQSNPEARLEYEARRHRRDLWGYAMLGDKNDAQSLPQYASQGPAHRIVSSLGLFLPIQWIVRGIIVGFSKPVDDAGWRDAAVDILSDPSQTDSRLMQETAVRLSESYFDMDRYEDAARWHTVANGGTADPAYMEKIREKQARQYLERAREEPEPDRKLAALERLAKAHPDTKSGKKARKEADNLRDAMPDVLQITRKELISFPELWQGGGLHLRREWLDGKKENGELTDDGVHFRDSEGRRLQFTVREAGGAQEYVVTPDAKSLAQLRGPLRAWLRENRTRSQMEKVLRGPGLGWSIEGAAGASGVDIYPALRPAPFDERALPLYDTIVAPRR